MIDYSDDDIDLMFRYSLTLDLNCRIVTIGAGFSELDSPLSVNDLVLDRFECDAIKFSDDLLRSILRGKVITLRCRFTGMRLRGVGLPRNGLIFLALNPFHISDKPKVTSGLTLSDFASSDNSADMQMLVQMQRGMLAEALESATELEAAREQSNELRKHLAEICGFLAHDFNNYLSIISLNMDAIEQGLPDKVGQSKSVDAVRRASVRGHELASSLISLSRDMEEQAEQLDIDRFIVDNQALLEAAAGQACAFRLSLGAESATAMVSSSGLAHVLVNLVLNARNALKDCPDAWIEVSTKCRNSRGANRLEIAVADSGNGIAESMQGKLFKRFASTKAKGGGLGLASVHSFCNRHGGSVSYRRAEAGNSIFTLTLPALQALPVVRSAPEHVADRAKPATSLNILILEDEPDALEAMADIIRTLGHFVAEAAHPEEAVELMLTRSFDIAFVDASISRNDQFDFVGWSKRRFPSTRLCRMSGSHEKLKKGAEPDWLALKPLNIGLLKDILHSS